jgi:hypothetical protein
MLDLIRSRTGGRRLEDETCDERERAEGNHQRLTRA